MVEESVEPFASRGYPKLLISKSVMFDFAEAYACVDGLKETSFICYLFLSEA
jgi:hypothetical protein